MPVERSARGRTTVLVATSAVAAVTALLALSGCGIRSTAVPVDAGLPASRTACPPTPGATAPLTPSVPADLASAEASYLLPGLPSTTPWEQLSSAVPAPSRPSVKHSHAAPRAAATPSPSGQSSAACPSVPASTPTAP
ncbi:hypothetical protein [Streptacidiphilus sp. MAP12-20]|uniref:hypothetical protein n=1 Tax=Streptacidiphilus sp. MAP12-20 TaxID=3156299 RepID=UPI003517962C